MKINFSQSLNDMVKTLKMNKNKTEKTLSYAIAFLQKKDLQDLKTTQTDGKTQLLMDKVSVSRAGESLVRS